MNKLIIALALLLITTTGYSQQAIHVTKSGKGDPVIFLPGFTTPGSVWNETIQHITHQKEFHVVSYAGFDGLAPIAMPWYDPIKQQLIEYIKRENLSNITVIGHSMGGNLAIELAAELPDRVKSLVLVDSIPCMRELMMPGVPASSLQYDSPYNNQLLAMPADAFAQMANSMSQNMTLDQSKIALLTEWAVKADRKTYVYGYTDLLKLDLRDKLPMIKAETLILGATFPNKEVVLSNFNKQYANLKSKEIVLADNSKHFIMFDQPEWFYGHINNFMSK